MCNVTVYIASEAIAIMHTETYHMIIAQNFGRQNIGGFGCPAQQNS